MFGVGPGWYRFRGGFARLCVCVGPVLRGAIVPRRPILLFFTSRINLSDGGFFWFFFFGGSPSPQFWNSGAQNIMPQKKTNAMRNRRSTSYGHRIRGAIWGGRSGCNTARNRHKDRLIGLKLFATKWDRFPKYHPVYLGLCFHLMSFYAARN